MTAARAEGGGNCYFSEAVRMEDRLEDELRGRKAVSALIQVKHYNV